MAQTQLYTKKAQVFVSVESTQDTYEEQTASEAILCEIPDNPFTINSENYAPTTVRGDFLSSDEVPGLASVTMSFRVPCHGSGAVGTAPEFADALLACGFRENIATGTPTEVLYEPNSTFDGSTPTAYRYPAPSYSVTLLEDGVAYQLKGGFSNLVLVGNVGEPLFLEFAFTGAYEDVAADDLETASYDTPAAPLFTGASFTHDFATEATPKGINNFTLDLGNTITVGNDINEASGVYGARVTNRKSFGSFDPEMIVPAANVEYDTYWQAGTTGVLTTGLVGGTAGNKWQIDIARCVLRPMEYSSREGIRVVTLNYAVSSAADDVEGTDADISLSFQ